MNGRWWRAYDDALHDPKVQSLPPKVFKVWFNVLCVASKYDGRLPDMGTLARLLGVRLDYTWLYVNELARRGLIDQLADHLEPHNWNKFQYKSDLSTARVKRFRNDVETANETLPDNRVQNTEKKKRDATHLLKKKMPTDFQPDREFAKARGWPNERIDAEAQRFRDHALAKGCTYANWNAAWRNWVTSPYQEGTNNGRAGPRPFQDDSKSASRAAARLAEAAERGEFIFGPKPSLLPEPRKDDASLLPPRRGSRS